MESARPWSTPGGTEDDLLIVVVHRRDLLIIVVHRRDIVPASDNAWQALYTTTGPESRIILPGGTKAEVKNDN